MFGDYITIFKARVLLKNVLYKKLFIYTKLYLKDEKKTVIRNLYPQYPALFDDFLDKFEANFKGIKFSILISFFRKLIW